MKYVGKCYKYFRNIKKGEITCIWGWFLGENEIWFGVLEMISFCLGIENIKGYRIWK